MRKKSIHAPRPRYQDKCDLVLKAIKRIVYEQKMEDKKEGYIRMSEIAEEAGYARSQRFMETLYSMCDDGLIEKIEPDADSPIVEKYVKFRLPSSAKQTSFTA